jgi:hypothetical protein
VSEVSPGHLKFKFQQLLKKFFIGPQPHNFMVHHCTPPFILSGTKTFKCGDENDEDIDIGCTVTEVDTVRSDVKCVCKGQLCNKEMEREMENGKNNSVFVSGSMSTLACALVMFITVSWA